MAIKFGSVYVKPLFNYQCTGEKKVGLITFRNGITYRFYRLAVHIWKPTKNYWRPFWMKSHE